MREWRVYRCGLCNISPCLYQPALLERRGEGRGMYRRKGCSDLSLTGS